MLLYWSVVTCWWPMLTRTASRFGKVGQNSTYYFFCLKDCMNNLLSKEWASYAKFSTSSHWLGSTSYSHIFLARLFFHGTWEGFFATQSFERVAWKNWFYPTICMLLSSNQQSLYARCLYIHLKGRWRYMYFPLPLYLENSSPSLLEFIPLRRLQSMHFISLGISLARLY